MSSALYAFAMVYTATNGQNPDAYTLKMGAVSGSIIKEFQHDFGAIGDNSLYFRFFETEKLDDHFFVIGTIDYMASSAGISATYSKRQSVVFRFFVSDELNSGTCLASTTQTYVFT